jgi:hypothetical protein
MKLEAQPNASRRTKDRIKKYGPVFAELKRASWHASLRCACVLVGNPKWMGWFPIHT